MTKSSKKSSSSNKKQKIFENPGTSTQNNVESSTPENNSTNRQKNQLFHQQPPLHSVTYPINYSINPQQSNSVLIAQLKNSVFFRISFN
jgi:hypothetical protein